MQSANQPQDGLIDKFDVVIVGAGAGGMAAALTASIHGLSAVILEKTDRVGGSTALSGGAVWIPCNDRMASVGQEDSREAVMRYLEATLGNRLDRAKVTAFLDQGPNMVDLFSANTDVIFAARSHSPDYHSDLPGASAGGRTLDPVLFDGRTLGADFELLRPPLHTFTVLGGMMVGKQDIDNLLGAFRSPKKFLAAANLLLRYMSDRLRHSRGTRLQLGNALAGRLFKSVLAHGIPVVLKADVTRLMTENGKVCGVETIVRGEKRTIRADRGVVLATGGYPGNEIMRSEYMPHADKHSTMAPAANDGGGIRLAREVGGNVSTGNASSAFWTPVSRMTMPDGSTKLFPHLLLDRQKPGLVAVNTLGRRFVNEACSYHEFVEAMHADSAGVPSYLICDSAFIRKYGLGLVRPKYDRHQPFIDAGYLISADTLDELANRIGVDAANLAGAVESMNQAAASGIDEMFGKGSTAYNRYLGDPDHKPNPCLGPIDRPPFFAVKVWPGDIGTATGLDTDSRSRVLTGDGLPIQGLYACGNDMNSIMAGFYPAAGITLGPALTFGYIAGLELAGKNTADLPPK